jgi:peptidoglycan hydrolase CwlO-like protein
MGFGSTAKKLQQVVDAADDLYAKINDLKDDIAGIQDTIEDTNERVTGVESELTEQRELLDAIAEAEGIEVETSDGDDSE